MGAVSVIRFGVSKCVGAAIGGLFAGLYIVETQCVAYAGRHGASPLPWLF
jgi:hypothetical protein